MNKISKVFVVVFIAQLSLIPCLAEDKNRPPVEPTKSSGQKGDTSSGNWRICNGMNVAIEKKPAFKYKKISAYKSPTGILLFVEKNKTIYCMNAMGWNLGGFVKAKNESIGRKKSILFEMGSENKHRFFDIRRGQEVFQISSTNNPLIVSDIPPPLPGNPVKILSRWSGRDSIVHEETFHLIKSRKDWGKTWNKISNDKIPNVDFNNHMIISMFLGDTVNINGITIHDFQEIKEQAVLRIRPEYFQTGNSPEDVSPYGVIVVPKMEKPLSIDLASQQFIGGPIRWRKAAQFNK